MPNALKNNYCKQTKKPVRNNSVHSCNALKYDHFTLTIFSFRSFFFINSKLEKIQRHKQAKKI
jgi:hypothetical protein